MKNQMNDYRIIYLFLLILVVLMFIETITNNEMVKISIYCVIIIITYIISLMDIMLLDELGINGDGIFKIIQWIIYLLLIFLIFKKINKMWK